MKGKAAIFTELTRRNAVRRQAQLPLLDMRDEFDRAVEFTHWQAVCEEHADRVRSGVIAEVEQDIRARTAIRWRSLGGQHPNAQTPSRPASIARLIRRHQIHGGIRCGQRYR